MPLDLWRSPIDPLERVEKITNDMRGKLNELTVQDLTDGCTELKKNLVEYRDQNQHSPEEATLHALLAKSLIGWDIAGAVSKAMLHYLEDGDALDLHLAGLPVLQHLAEFIGKEEGFMKYLLKEKKAAHTIITISSKFPVKAPLQGTAFSALGRVAEKCGNDKLATALFEQMSNANAIGTILRALEEGDKQLVKEVCQMIGRTPFQSATSTGAHKGLFEEVLEKRIVLVIANLMMQGEDKSDSKEPLKVQQYGLFALRRLLTACDQANTMRVLADPKEEEVMKDIVSVLQQYHSKNQAVREDGLFCIHRILHVGDASNKNFSKARAIVIKARDLFVDIGVAAREDNSCFTKTTDILAYCGTRSGPAPTTEDVEQVEAAAAFRRIADKGACSLMGAALLTKDLVLPLIDTGFDVVNLRSFWLKNRFVYFAAIACAMAMHTCISTVLAWLHGRRCLAVADFFTVGTASQVVHVVRSWRRGGVMVREVMMAKRLEGSESLISFFVTANSLIVAGVYEGHEAFEGWSLAAQWAGVSTSILCLSFLAWDLDKVASYQNQSPRYRHMRKGLDKPLRVVSILLFHATGIASTLISMHFMMVWHPLGGPLFCAFVLLLGIGLFAASITGGFDGDWEVVAVNGVADTRGLTFAFDGETIRTFSGETFEFKLNEDTKWKGKADPKADDNNNTDDNNQTKDPNDPSASKKIEPSDNTKRGIHEFEVELMSADLMKWKKGGYIQTGGAPRSWSSRLLVRVETAGAYSRRTWSDGNTGHMLSFMRACLSFATTMFLLIVIVPVGHAHPKLLRRVSWLRPAVCLMLWIFVIARARIDEVALEMLMNHNSLILLAISAGAFILHVPLAMYEGFRGRFRSLDLHDSGFNLSGMNDYSKLPLLQGP